MDTTGQVNYEDNKLGRYLVDISGLPDVKTIVEIGTWNGAGTTRCILTGIKNSNKTDYDFTTLECSPEFYIIAIKNNCKIINKNMHFIHGKIVDEDLIDKWFDTSILSSEQYGWMLQDKGWMAEVPNVLDIIPQQIDFLVLDGGEYSTYLEWQLLKDRVKYVALDDTQALKCKRIREEVLADDSFEIIEDDLHGSRYGFLVFKKK